MTQPSIQPPTPTAEEKAAAVQAHQSLAARLRYLTQQAKQIKDDQEQVKAALEDLYTRNLIPAEEVVVALYSDGSQRRIKLARKKTGTYFRVGDEHKEEFSADKQRLEARYLKAGKASMADKACTWEAREVK
jgi:hypothetical protein